MQKFMQKIFPSKSGKERIRQLEKIDKLMDKSKKTGTTKTGTTKTGTTKTGTKKISTKKNRY